MEEFSGAILSTGRVTNGAVIITGYVGPVENLDIPSTVNGLPVTSIAQSAFAYNSSLTNVIIAQNVTNVGDMAFFGCERLHRVLVGKNVNNIGEGALASCSSLMEILVDPSNAYYSD